MKQSKHEKNYFQRFQTSMMNRMAPRSIMVNDSLIYWRVRILFAIMLTTFCLCFIALIPFIFMAMKEKLWGLAIFDGISFLMGAGILFSRRLSYQLRTVIFLLLLYVVGLGIILFVGPLSGGPAWLFSFAVLAGVLLGSRAAIVALGLNAVTLMTMGWLISKGLPGQTFPFFNTMEAMMVAGVNFMLLNVVTAISVAVLVKGLVSSHQKRNALSDTLEQERVHLIEAKNKLEIEVEERKQAEEKNARYNRILEGSLNEIYIFDADTLNFIEVNRGARKNLGYTTQEFSALSPLDLKPEFTAESFAELVEPLRTGDKHKIQFTTVHQRKDGSLYPVEIHLQLMHQDSPVFVAIILDITERMQAEKEKNRLENQYRQAQKMESVGRLAGGVAHDYNNALSVIIGFTEMAIEDVDPNGPLRANLNQVLTAAGRAADITRQLLTFARKQTIAPKVLDLNESVESIFKMLRRLIGEDISLAWLPRASLWLIKMDPSQIDQILANLCVNARDAIAGVGKITIETKNVAFDKAYCTEHTGFVPGEFVLLTVNDNGCGMDKNILDNIFEPFFTTKDVDKGTGLGLAMVYGIIKQNNGFINVSSEPGKGTTIKMYLPRYNGQTTRIQAETTAKTPMGQGETVLLVEDDLLILKLAGKILDGLDYRVLSVGTPEKALELANKHAGKIHLLITDVIMPEMNGRELADRLQAIYPGIRRLFMSGYTANTIAHHGVLDKGVNFLQKPFCKKDLAKAVKKALTAENENSVN